MASRRISSISLLVLLCGLALVEATPIVKVTKLHSASPPSADEAQPAPQPATIIVTHARPSDLTALLRLGLLLPAEALELLRATLVPILDAGLGLPGYVLDKSSAKLKLFKHGHVTVVPLHPSSGQAPPYVLLNPGQQAETALLGAAQASASAMKSAARAGGRFLMMPVTSLLSLARHGGGDVSAKAGKAADAEAKAGKAAEDAEAKAPTLPATLNFDHLQRHVASLTRFVGAIRPAGAEATETAAADNPSAAVDAETQVGRQHNGDQQQQQQHQESEMTKAEPELISSANDVPTGELRGSDNGSSSGAVASNDKIATGQSQSENAANENEITHDKLAAARSHVKKRSVPHYELCTIASENASAPVLCAPAGAASIGSDITGALRLTILPFELMRMLTVPLVNTTLGVPANMLERMSSSPVLDHLNAEGLMTALASLTGHNKSPTSPDATAKGGDAASARSENSGDGAADTTKPAEESTAHKAMSAAQRSGRFLLSPITSLLSRAAPAKSDGETKGVH